ncbi:hypothetical protein ACJRO7_026878 [Eucalyptus globulus]|uniref:Uncharacterized protein n=1 Tax=Eucalyptus globulus TaxID=34317 RepID=A0ABD3JQF0_EUCGL
MIEIVFAFKGEGRGSCSTAIETIRASLAEVLIDFYPFAGRLVMGSDGKMAATCTGEGVLFVEAMSDDDIGMLGNISVINPGTLRKLVKLSDGAQTMVEEPLLTVQVTTFKCRGITVGIVMNHVLVDGKALTDFLTCWSDVARGRSPSILPFLDRSVLCPRRPPRVDLPRHEYAPIDRPSERIIDPQTKPHVYRSFNFEPHTLIQLKKVSTITTHDGSTILPTSFEVISALFDPPLPSGYFGNGIAWSCAECSAGELTRKPFLFAVRTVQEVLRCVTESYIRSAINHVELNSVVGNACCISKWSRLPFYETDFGFRRPFHVAPTSGETDNLVMSLGLPCDAIDVFSELIQSELALMNKY